MPKDPKFRSEVIALFQKYGFEHRKSFSGSGFEGFTYKSGFFYNAELVSLSCWDDLDEQRRINAQKQLKDLKFSTKVKEYESIEEIENDLFTGFFDVKTWKVKIGSEYENHCKRSLAAFPGENLEYKYISGKFVKNSDHAKTNNKNLIDDIRENISSQGAKLIIVEAPAGYGKTCASYEIIKCISEHSDEQKIPFFAEFARDRQAKVFSHILMREVDRSFSSVRSGVVIDEMKAGKVIVVLDGFDELLQEVPDSDKSNFEAAEQMLETISELLEGNAKVILTSRRSAIFDGEAFREWMSSHETLFEVDRYRLEKPTLEDWLTWERIKKLEEHSIDLRKIANPVLLGYLRSLNDVGFDDVVENSDSIVDYYFGAMMDRENERQNLLMNSDEQIEVLQLIAADMSEKNYTSDSKESLVKLILDAYGNALYEIRKRHPIIERPTAERLATTLANHAFLDRCDEGGNLQFVNEFALGYFLAGCAVKSEEWIVYDERFVEPPVLSYVSMPDRKRVQLWEALQTMLEFVTKSDRARYEFMLCRRFSPENFSNEEIRKVSFEGIPLITDESLSKVVFTECIFKEVDINADQCIDVTFLNCEFWDCNILGSATDDQVHFYACGGNNQIVQEWNDQDASSESDKNFTPLISDVEQFILMAFFQASSMNVERLQVFTGNYFKDSEYPRKVIIKAIRSLRQRGLLVGANDHSFIAIDKGSISVIKGLLAREHDQ